MKCKKKNKTDNYIIKKLGDKNRRMEVSKKHSNKVIINLKKKRKGDLKLIFFLTLYSISLSFPIKSLFFILNIFISYFNHSKLYII
jgi:hypothetical protein